MSNATPSFTHLSVHTHYSIVDGLIGIDDLLKTALSMGMTSIAITDQCNLFSLVKFYQAALRYGIKPIIGADLCLHNTQQQATTRPNSAYPLTMLCQDQTGYRHLSRLISRCYQEGQQQGSPQLSMDWLTPESTAGLLVLSGDQKSDIGTALLAGNADLADHYLSIWKTLLGDRFYLTLQRLGRPGEEAYNHALLLLAEKHQVPVVATNAVRFLKAEDWDAHEARVCIYEGCTLEEKQNKSDYTPQQYLRSPDEMASLFADLPEAIQNSTEIAKRCNFTLTLGTYFLPKFPVPKNTNLNTYFKQMAEKGLTQRLEQKKAAQLTVDTALYQQRLHMEIDVIDSMGFSAYFLIVADFIQWAKQQTIPVGPGRGSAPGSLVAYSLGITNVDPIVYDLAFERFLNKSRISMPDIDIDFCVNGRDRTIDYVIEKFGRQSVAQIITYGTMAAKAVVRDTGRVLGYPYGFVDKLAKLIPFEIDMTLRKALQQEAELNQRFQNEEDVNRLITLAVKLEGTPRNIGKHAGGLVVAPSHLSDFTPLYCEPNGKNLITQLDKDDIETIGLVKFDFLGLRTLTIIQTALDQINTTQCTNDKSPIDMDTLSLDDKKTYDLLSSGLTTAVFQIESHGMKELVKRLQPQTFNDVVALIALYRPGPLQSGMVDDYIDRRHGRASVTYPHPHLEPVLKTTYGIILYQEQVMKIAQVLAGYSLDEADLLRRAMGKKKHEEMAKHRTIFIQRASKQAISPELAGTIFDLMEKFAGYGFNKSHSVSYAILTYQTAWLKAHYPCEFMAAVLSSDMDNTDKVIVYIEDCRQFNITICPPDINASHYPFTVNKGNRLRYGLGAIKGVGEAAVQTIIQARADQPFKSLLDFCTRIDTHRVNKRTLEALIFSGALDCFKEPRHTLLASLEQTLFITEQNLQTKASGQTDLFGALDENNALLPKQPPNTVATNVPAWTEGERLKHEKAVLGLYLSGHPIAAFRDELTRMGVASLNKIQPGQSSWLVAGYIANVRTKFTRKGQKIAFVTLDDGHAHLDLTLFSQAYTQYQSLLVKDQLIIVKGEVSIDDFNNNYKMNTESIYSLDQARNLYGKQLHLHLNNSTPPPDFAQRLQSTLTPFVGGTCPLVIHYKKNKAKGSLLLGDDWRITISQPLINALAKLVGNDKNIQVVY